MIVLFVVRAVVVVIKFSLWYLRQMSHSYPVIEKGIGKYMFYTIEKESNEKVYQNFRAKLGLHSLRA